MIYLLYVLISGLFVLDWLFFRYGIGIRPLTWIPEFISVIVAVSIPFKTAVTKQINLPLKYSILLTIYIANLIIGFLLNDVNGWVMLAGLRIYTKFLPVFLLPIIFSFTEHDFRKLILFVFVLAMIQFPVVLWQRFVKYSASLSGDPMGGTLGYSTSGVLAIFLLAVISFLVAFYFKEIISMPVFLLSLAAAFIPITLNETKISFVLLPIAFIFPALFLKAKRESIFRAMLVVIIFFSSVFVLKNIYNYFQQKRWGYGIETFVAMPERLNEYSRTRLNPIKYAFTKALSGPRFTFFGHGAGNVSEGFTRKLNGKYIDQAYYYGVYKVSFTLMMWETGIIGTITFFVFSLLIFLDALNLCKEDGLTGAFSLGMLSFVIFFILSTFYTTTLDTNVLMYLFFLSGGYVASRRYAGAEEKQYQPKNDNEIDITGMAVV